MIVLDAPVHTQHLLTEEYDKVKALRTGNVPEDTVTADMKNITQEVTADMKNIQEYETASNQNLADERTPAKA